jgi:hypothetical protein
MEFAVIQQILEELKLQQYSQIIEGKPILKLFNLYFSFFFTNLHHF